MLNSTFLSLTLHQIHRDSHMWSEWNSDSNEDNRTFSSDCSWTQVSFALLTLKACLRAKKGCRWLMWFSDKIKFLKTILTKIRGFFWGLKNPTNPTLRSAEKSLNSHERHEIRTCLWKGSLLKYLWYCPSTHITTLPILELAQIQPPMASIWCC